MARRHRDFCASHSLPLRLVSPYITGCHQSRFYLFSLGCTDDQAVESAFVPVMKTVISGVEVDLLFARVNLPEAGDQLDIEKDEILRGVDDASQRSLNGMAAALDSLSRLLTR